MSYTGTWNLTMQTPMGNREVSVALTEDGGALTGTASADGNSNEIKDGSVADGKAKFSVDVTSPMPLTLEFEIEADGDAVTGNCKLGMFGNAPVTGSKA